MDQLSLLCDSFPTDLTLIKKSLNEMILSVCMEQDIDVRNIKIEDRIVTVNNIPQHIGYSIWILEPKSMKKSDRIFSIVVINTDKTKRYEIETKYDYCNYVPVPDGAIEKVYNVKSKDTEGRVTQRKKYVVHFTLDNSEISNYLLRLIKRTVEDFKPSDKFGCCSKYNECSNLKKCVHKDKLYSRSCWYRQNLESGKIFYGVNKNIG